MSSVESPPPKPEARYHHGDLRSALILAAREALAEAPPESLTLKSLALRLGVSQPAPYRHFASRDALLAAVAADGFRRFEAQLREASAAAEGLGPARAFEAGCRAYLAFARRNAGVYRLMFGSSVDMTAASLDLAEAAVSAFNLLLESFQGEGRRPRALLAWSALHGMATLEAAGRLFGPPSPEGAALGEEDLLAELARRFGGDE